jgi:putative ABC transport system ATP-binding protein
MKDEQLAVFRRQKIGFIFQNYNLIPSLNVWENVVLPIGLDNRRVNTAFVEDLLKTIGLSDRKKALPSMLSGGQQQRVAIARAIAAEPAIILADEPTGNLDTKTELEVMSLLKKSVEKFGQTLIMITHDEGIAQTADHIVHLEDGRVI